jgi:uncharacterized protein
MIKRSKQYLVAFVGVVSFVLGLLGIVLPLLPTTPFILLAAFCFARSSPGLDQWLRNHPTWGKLIVQFSDGKGVATAIKTRAIILIWLSLGISMLILFQLWSTLLLVFLGLCLTSYLSYLPTRSPQDTPKGNEDTPKGNEVNSQAN